MRFRASFMAIVLTGAGVFVAFPALAEEEHAPHAEADGEPGHHADEGHHFNNGLALFLGATDEKGHGTEPTWGLEYARWLSDRWAVGGLFDYAGGEQRNAVIAPAVFWKPFGGGFTLVAAPGVEYHSGRGTAVEPHLLKAAVTAVDEDETYFVFRLGAAYWFHFGHRYGLAPAVNVDFVNGHEVLIYGVNFEVMF